MSSLDLFKQIAAGHAVPIAAVITAALIAALRWCRARRDKTPAPEMRVTRLIVTFVDRVKNFLWGIVAALGAVITTTVMTELGYVQSIAAWLIARFGQFLPVLLNS